MRTRVHINLAVSDLGRSIAFYETLMGQPPTKRCDDYANWRLDAPALHLALMQGPADLPKQAGEAIRHFGVELFDDGELADWRARLEQAGISLRVEQRVTCCYAVADKFWAADPDGNEWEFWVRHEEADAVHDSQASACCAPATKATAAQPATAKSAAAQPCCTPSAKKASADFSSCC